MQTSFKIKSSKLTVTSLINADTQKYLGRQNNFNFVIRMEHDVLHGARYPNG